MQAQHPSPRAESIQSGVKPASVLLSANDSCGVALARAGAMVGDLLRHLPPSSTIAMDEQRASRRVRG